MSDRRRWLLRLLEDQVIDQTARVVVEVPADGTGVVWLAVDGGRVALHPRDVSRLRRVLQLAQARALLDRGAW